MNILKRNLILTTLPLLTSCIHSVKEFTDDELKWCKPFDKNKTIVFISEKSEFDTIIFKKSTLTNENVNDLERGFYKSNYLSVPYEFSKGSFHQFNLDGNIPSEQYLVSIEKSSAGFGSMEVSFIGLLFNENEIKKAQKIETKTYQFDSSNATAKLVNVRDGIKSFSFSTEAGIVNYVDERNIKWTRNRASH